MQIGDGLLGIGSGAWCGFEDAAFLATLLSGVVRLEWRSSEVGAGKLLEGVGAVLVFEVAMTPSAAPDRRLYTWGYGH